MKYATHAAPVVFACGTKERKVIQTEGRLKDLTVEFHNAELICSPGFRIESRTK
jgi:hypothetical protein